MKSKSRIEEILSNLNKDMGELNIQKELISKDLNLAREKHKIIQNRNKLSRYENLKLLQ